LKQSPAFAAVEQAVAPTIVPTVKKC